MSIPINKIFYLNTSSFTGTTYGGLSDGVAPPTTNTTFGWNTGRNNPPLFCELNWNQEVGRTSTQWQATPTSSIPTQNAGGSGAGNCWVVGPIHGEFLSGNWDVSMSMKQVTTAATHTGRFHYRFWSSPTGSGAGATLLSPTFFTSSILSFTNTLATVITGTGSFTLPRVNLNDEYLLIQTYWSIVTSPGGGVANNDVDGDYVLGVNSKIQSTGFVTSRPSLVVWDESY